MLDPQGYHLLLEKPMAVTEQDCKQIKEACERQVLSFLVTQIYLIYSSLVEEKRS